jgi:hypothetical protein
LYAQLEQQQHLRQCMECCCLSAAAGCSTTADMPL